MLIKGAHWAFYWPKYACINLADVWIANLLVDGTCLYYNILYLKSPINVNKYRLRPTTWTQRLTSIIH